MIIEKSRTSTRHYQHLREILGKEYIKSEIESPFDFISLATQGIDTSIILNFQKHFEIPRSFVAELLNVSEPTIYRWIKGKKKLDRNFSIQLFELADLFLFGAEIFESKEAFFEWLHLPSLALGGLQPREVLAVPNGIGKVRDLIGHIEYGVYS